MNKHMLRKALGEFLRPLIQLIQNLLNPDKGEEWEREFKRFLRKEKCWTGMSINTDIQPTIPDELCVDKLEIYQHEGFGVFEWDPDNIHFAISEKQKSSFIIGGRIFDVARGKKVLNATVLNYLLDNPELIPDEWMGKCIPFLGTVYESGRLKFVSTLFWNSKRWAQGLTRIDNNSWDSLNPVPYFEN